MSGRSLSDTVRLVLSDKDLFGRENEIKTIQDSLDRITVHMHLLLQAEMMTWNKNNSPEYRQEVRRAFDKAINTASRNGFCHHAGMANERAATYHSEFDTEQAEHYWHQAFGRYEDWGAGRKYARTG